MSQIASIIGGNPCPPPLRRTSWLAPIATALLGAVWAWPYLFTTFSEYDDEGFMMASVRRMLDRQPLYDSIAIPYGPCYCASRWFVFGLLDVPLTHDMVRLVTFLTWIVTASVFGLALVRVLPRNNIRAWLASLGIVGSMYVMRALTNEPGHPQELIVLFLACTLLAGTWIGTRVGWSWGILGVLCAATILTKVNIGIFLSAACLMTLAMTAPRGTAGTVLRWSITFAVALLPLALLRSVLASPGYGKLCFITTTGIALCGLIAAQQPAEANGGLRSWLAFALGGIVGAAVFVGFALVQGASLHGTIWCLFVMPAKLIAVFVPTAPVGRTNVAVSLASAMLALAVAYGRRRFPPALAEAAVACMKLAAVTVLVWGFTRVPWNVVRYGPSLGWLTLLIPVHRRPRDGEISMRMLMALVAVLQLLQVFPIPGSQLYIGALAFVPLGILLLSDVSETLAAVGTVHGALAARYLIVASALVGLGGLGKVTVDAWREFRRSAPVQLPGCRWLRIPESQAAFLQWALENVKDSDNFISPLGLNSMSFWSGRPPFTDDAFGPLLVSWTWNLVPDEVQSRLVEKMRKHPNLLVIDNIAVRPGVDDWKNNLVGKYVEAEFAQVAADGDYRLSRLIERPDKPFLACAWYRNALAPAKMFRPKELRVVLPSGMSSIEATRVVLVNLDEHRIMADSTEPARRISIILDEPPTRGHGPDSAPAMFTLHDGDRLRLPESATWDEYDFAVLRFLDAAGRSLLTLPVVRLIR